jgi:hypothetical protein
MGLRRLSTPAATAKSSKIIESPKNAADGRLICSDLPFARLSLCLGFLATHQITASSQKVG